MAFWLVCSEIQVLSEILRRANLFLFHPQNIYTEPSMAQYVMTMNRVGKVVPPKRQILKDISLSFFPGAKIGVLGESIPTLKERSFGRPD